MDDNLKQMLQLAGVDFSEKSDTQNFTSEDTKELNAIMELAGVSEKKKDAQLNEHIIGGMQEVKHISERHDDYEDYSDDGEEISSEDELHDIEMLADNIESSEDIKEYNQDGLELDSENPQVDLDVADTGKDAPTDVSELIAIIDDIQSMGLSGSDKHYDTEKLMKMSPEAVERIYNKVMAEEGSEFMEDSYEEDDKTVDYVEDDNEVETEVVDTDGYFPDGAHHQMASKTGASGAKHGDNGLQKTMRVSEEIEQMHMKMVNDYRNFLKENRK